MANKEKLELATHAQLMEWLARGKGLMLIDVTDIANPKCTTTMAKFVYEEDLNKPVSKRIRIRRWGDSHWRLPVVNYINKDLKETTQGDNHEQI